MHGFMHADDTAPAAAAITAARYGCFTWEQLARLHVLCYPRSPTPALVVMAAMEVLQESDAATAAAASMLQKQQAQRQLHQHHGTDEALGALQELGAFEQQQVQVKQQPQDAV